MLKKTIVDKSDRLQKLPLSPFLELERTQKRLAKKGVNIIDLGRFDPQGMDPFFPSSQKEVGGEQIVRKDDLNKESLSSELKSEIASWFEKRYQVILDPKNEILPVFSISHTLTNLTLSFINPKDKVGIPDPSDPLYKTATLLAGGEIKEVPLLERNDHLPNLKNLPSNIRFLFLSYPNNPTTAMADLYFFQEVVKWASENNVVLLLDASFAEIYYNDSPPFSLMQIKGAKKTSVELHSFHRGESGPGFLVGHKDIILGMEFLEKTFVYAENRLWRWLRTATQGLDNYSKILQNYREEFEKRKNLMTFGLLSLGWKAKKAKATPFVWCQVPAKYSSLGFARMLLKKTGVITTPGSGFGENGEGYLRIALNVPEVLILEALERIKKHSHIWQRKYRPKAKKVGIDQENGRDQTA